MREKKENYTGKKIEPRQREKWNVIWTKEKNKKRRELREKDGKDKTREESYRREKKK